MKQAKSVLFFFLAAAFTAGLTGCPGPGPDRDMNVQPGDAGPDSDGNVDLPDAGPPDEGVPPDGGTDMGADAGPLPSPCDDPEYVGTECNLPEGMAYNMDAFTCAGAIDSDLWQADGASEPSSVSTTLFEGRLYGNLEAIVGRNGGIVGTPLLSFTCGNENRCWFNWYNMSSNYSKCRISFSGDCSHATVECWLPGSATPIPSGADYAGPI